MTANTRIEWRPPSGAVYHTWLRAKEPEKGTRDRRVLVIEGKAVKSRSALDTTAKALPSSLEGVALNQRYAGAQETSPNAMDVRYINPFIEAVKHVFKTMLQTEILVSKPMLKDRDNSSADVSAIIGFTGNATGSVSLCFSKQVAVRVGSKFAGAELSIYEPEMLADALGELTNMVAGQAKAKIPESSIAISLPRVVLGEEHRVLESNATPVLVLPCDSTLGRFSAEVTMLVKQFSPFSVAVNLGIKRPR